MLLDIRRLVAQTGRKTIPRIVGSFRESRGSAFLLDTYGVGPVYKPILVSPHRMTTLRSISESESNPTQSDNFQTGLKTIPRIFVSSHRIQEHLCSSTGVFLPSSTPRGKGFVKKRSRKFQPRNVVRPPNVVAIDPSRTKVLVHGHPSAAR